MRAKHIRRLPTKTRGVIVGRAAATKIAAVEGIVLSKEMRQLFRSFDRQGLSAEQRRRRLLERYGKVSN